MSDTAEKRLRLIVVDDNADMRESLKMLLEVGGYEVATAPDGRHALELQGTAPADVLITDIFMPDIDGLETINQFRTQFPAVKIIAMSGGGRRAMGADYLSTAGVAGADAILEKPFTRETLMQVLRSVESRAL